MDFNEENRSDMECKQMVDVQLGDFCVASVSTDADALEVASRERLPAMLGVQKTLPSGNTSGKTTYL